MTLLKQRYELQQTLEQAPPFTTWLARDTAGRGQVQCVVKQLALGDPHLDEVFERQANVLRNLRHESLPVLVDYFSADGQAYLVEKYIDAPDLGNLIRNGRHLNESDALRILRDLAQALKYLHSFSPPVLHGNIKPSNILVGKRDQVYLTDPAASRLRSIETTPLPDQMLQEAYGYLPLEAFRGQNSPATDIYSLGACMIFALSHIEPARLGSPGEALDFQRQVNVSPELIRVLERMTAPKPQDRYPSAEALLKDLRYLRPLASHASKTAPSVRPSVPREAASRDQAEVPIRVRRKEILLRLQPAQPEKPAPQWAKNLMGWVVLLIFAGTGALWLWSDDAPQPVPVSRQQPPPKPILGTPEISTAQAEYRVGEEIQILYAGLPGNQQDWLTIAPTNAPDTTYKEWRFTEGRQRGEMAFKGLPAGEYELRLFLDWPRGGYQARQRYHFRVLGDSASDREVVSEIVSEIKPPPVKPLDKPLIAYSLKVSLSYDGQPLQATRPPVFTVTHVATQQVYQPEYVQNGGVYELQEVPGGKIEVKATITPPVGTAEPAFTSEAASTLEIRDNAQPLELAMQRVGVSTAEGIVLYDGQLLSLITPMQPNFWYRDETKGKVVKAQTRYSDGQFSVSGLPLGRSGVQVTLDFNKNNPVNYPGDFYSWTTFETKTDAPADVTVNLTQVLRMTAPQDNNTVMQSWGSECMKQPAFPASPLRLAWVPLGDGVDYAVRIDRMNCLNNYNSAGQALQQTVSGRSELVVHLPPSLDNEVYGLHLYAKRDGKTIGQLMTHGNNGMGWDYRFRIAD